MQESSQTVRMLLLPGAVAFVLLVILLGARFFRNLEGAETERQKDSVSTQMFQPQKRGVIVLDAGHGGYDGGKEGINGRLEKDINLEIAEKLSGELLENGFDVVMTRTDDSSLCDEDTDYKKRMDLDRRIETIEQADPLLVISIHQNSYPDEHVQGAQVFYYSGSEKGKALADCIQNAVVKEVQPGNHRKSKDNSSYYLLKKTAHTIVIVECGFLSNPEEAAQLSDGSYQQKMAAAITHGIIDFYDDFE